MSVEGAGYVVLIKFVYMNLVLINSCFHLLSRLNFVPKQ